MTLIIEAGATKTAWLLIDAKGNTVAKVETTGINFSTICAEAIAKSVDSAVSVLPCGDVGQVFLYSAGLPDDNERKLLLQTFEAHFPKMTEFAVESDLMAAARAVCTHSEGIAAILGTGSNSCHYDGQKIIGHVNSGGYIIGDEGSAAGLGKLFLSDFIKNLVPKEIAKPFSKEFDGSYTGIVRKLYGGVTAPSAYLGSFAPFIVSHYDHPYIKRMVDGNFADFFERCILQYPSGLPIGIAGGFGYAYRDIVRSVAASKGLEISVFVKSPIDRLADFHKA